MRKTVLLFFFAIQFLTACGGGGSDPTVTEVSARSLKYGQPAEILVAGKYLRADMVVEAPGCSVPTFRSDSGPDLAVITCNVATVGPVPLTIRAAGGGILFSATLTVPQPQVTLLTGAGTVVLDLNPQAAPKSVNNFLSYVNSGFYGATLFHRVIPGFVVQGGGFTTGMKEKAGLSAPIALESNNGLLNKRATVAMARTGDPNSATSQFFINLVDNTSLDFSSQSSPGYAVFGRVVSGMDVVDAIAAAPTKTVAGFNDVPATEVSVRLAIQTQ